DGSPGEETIVAEANSLRVFKTDGSSTILSPDRFANFQGALVLTEDLDGDSQPEVLAWGRDFNTNTAYLFAWRRTGQLLANFPLAVSDLNWWMYTLAVPRVLVADLDGD